ncbi:MAG: HNH endonuclease [Candidatus Acidiferrales bacterium]
MHFYVAVTDADWFNYLSGSGPHDEVNFWQPSAGRQFRSLNPGEPFLFKLHSPRNYIVGGGFFLRFTVLPVSFAWDAFTTKNGARTEQEMRARIARYRRIPPSPGDDYQIGCILLQSPFFFSEEYWIPASDWSPNIVQGRTYDTLQPHGTWLWQQVEDHLRIAAAVPSGVGSPQIVFPRLGQGSFRVMVADAYNRRCAVTDSPVLYVLDAAHIRPFKEEGPHDVRNGILLRQDVHTLFDRGYITVTPEFRVEVSHLIKEEFENGHEYYSAQGKGIALPQDSGQWPARDFLCWHNENVYLG